MQNDEPIVEDHTSSRAPHDLRNVTITPDPAQERSTGVVGVKVAANGDVVSHGHRPFKAGLPTVKLSEGVCRVDTRYQATAIVIGTPGYAAHRRIHEPLQEQPKIVARGPAVEVAEENNVAFCGISGAVLAAVVPRTRDVQEPER
jgi:hypothetical protein